MSLRVREVPGSIPGAAHSSELQEGDCRAYSGRETSEADCHPCWHLVSPSCARNPLYRASWPAGAQLRAEPAPLPSAQGDRGESGWCSDMTSTHGAWRHAGVRFLLSGGAWPNSLAINHDCGWGLLSGSHRQASSCRPSRAEQQLLMRSKSLPCLLTSPSWPTPDGCLV